MKPSANIKAICENLIKSLKKDYPVTGSATVKPEGKRKLAIIIFFDELIGDIPKHGLPKTYKGRSVSYGINCS